MFPKSIQNNPLELFCPSSAGPEPRLAPFGRTRSAHPEIGESGDYNHCVEVTPTSLVDFPDYCFALPAPMLAMTASETMSI